MPERFRGELLTMGRYTNPASFFLYIVAMWRCLLSSLSVVAERENVPNPYSLRLTIQLLSGHTAFNRVVSSTADRCAVRPSVRPVPIRPVSRSLVRNSYHVGRSWRDGTTRAGRSQVTLTSGQRATTARPHFQPDSSALSDRLVGGLAALPAY